MQVKEAQALRGGNKIEFRQPGATVTFELPSVADYEVLTLT
jgi:hypothetical protein